jgi:hypothetical protein
VFCDAAFCASTKNPLARCPHCVAASVLTGGHGDHPDGMEQASGGTTCRFSGEVTQ